MEILPRARKHGISDDDIRHAFEHAVASITVPDRADFSMIVRPAQSARLLGIWCSPMTTTTAQSMQCLPDPSTSS